MVWYGTADPWEHYPHRWHDHTMYIGAMIVDTHPVTNAQYAACESNA